MRLGPVCPVDCGLPQSDVLSACVALSTGFDISAHSSDVCGQSLRRGQGHVAVRTWPLRLWRWSVLGSFKALPALGGLLFVPGVAALEPGSGSRDLSLSKRVFPAAALVPRTLCSWRPRVGLGGPLGSSPLSSLGARVAMAGAVGWGVCWGPLPLQLLPAALSDVSRSLGGAAQPLVTQSVWPLRPAWQGRGGGGAGGWTGRQEQRRRCDLCGHVRADGAVSGWLSRLLHCRGRAPQVCVAASAEPPGPRGLDSGSALTRPCPGWRTWRAPRAPHRAVPTSRPRGRPQPRWCVLFYRSRAGPWLTVQLAG